MTCRELDNGNYMMKRQPAEPESDLVLVHGVYMRPEDVADYVPPDMAMISHPERKDH